MQEVFYIDDPFVVDELASFGFNDFYLLGHKEILIQKLRGKMGGVLDEIVGEQKLQEVEMLLDEICEGQMEEDNGDFYYSSKKHLARLNIRSISTGMKIFVILKTLIQKGFIQENGTVIFR